MYDGFDPRVGTVIEELRVGASECTAQFNVPYQTYSDNSHDQGEHSAMPGAQLVFGSPLGTRKSHQLRIDDSHFHQRSHP